MYGSWDTEWDWQKFLSFLVIFCPFIHLMILKIKILKKMTKMPEDIIPLHMRTINEDNMMHDSWNTSWETKFFVILNHFLPFHHPDNLKIKKKNTWRYYHFTHVHHKWQSYDKWFLRYGASQTELFFIFCPFTPLTTEKIKTFEKWRKTLEILF